jgi:aquaporin related protein
MLGSDPTGFCVSLPNKDVGDMKAFWVEFFITMALIMLCGGVWDPRNKNHHDSVPLRFGLAVAGLALVGVIEVFYFNSFLYFNSV